MGPPILRKPDPRHRVPNRIRFALERYLLRGLGHRLLLAASIVAGVALFAGILVTLLDPGFSGAEDGVWWAFLRLTDPGYLGDDEGLAGWKHRCGVTPLTDGAEGRAPANRGAPGTLRLPASQR